MAQNSNETPNKTSNIDALITKLKSTETFAEGEKQLKELWAKAKEGGKKTAQSVGRAIIHGLAAAVAKKGLPLLAKLGTKAIAALNHPSWYADADKSVSGLISAFKPTTAEDVRNRRLICGLGIVPLEISKLIDLSILRDQITTAISSFDSMLGNPSGLEYDQIIDVLKAGTDVVALLTIGLRHYNGRKAKLITNTEIHLQNAAIVNELVLEHLTAAPAEAFVEGYKSYRYDTGDDDYAENLISGTSIVLPTYPTISNNVWNTDIVSPVCSVFCPDKVYELINYLYSGYFTNGPEEGVNGLVMFMEASLIPGATVNWQTKITDAMNVYRQKLAVNPFLNQFMTNLGFGKPLQQKADMYNRWRAADIYNVYQDDSIIASIANYMTVGMYGTDSQINASRYKYNADSLDILDNSDDVDITFDPNNILITNIPLGHIGSLIKLWLMKPTVLSKIFCIGVQRSISDTAPYKATYALLQHSDMKNLDHSFNMDTATGQAIAEQLVAEASDVTKVRKFILFFNNQVFNGFTSGLTSLEVVGLINSKDYEYTLYVLTSGSDGWLFTPSVSSRNIVIDGTDTFTVNNLGDIIKVIKTNVTTHYNFSESYKKALELWNQTNNITKF